MNGTKLTGLYEHQTKEGETFFAGKLSPYSRLLIFRNRHKREEKDPDYFAFLVPRGRSKAPEQAEEPGP